MVTSAIQRLHQHITTIPNKYRRFTSEELLNKPALGKWSRQEILGHLIDSATNNLQRFNLVQFMPQPYMVYGYRQNELVTVNNYQQLPLEHLLTLWSSLNQQIIYAVENIPAGKLSYTIQLQSGEVKTLAWLIVDYVDHMEHHWKQVFTQK
jgi:hypothetical protein